jgi:hypothetical protein
MPNNTSAPAPKNRPNEAGRLEIMDHVKIYDPNDKKVIVEKRA